MGVNYLWDILSPISHAQSLSQLRGKTVAVDLSSWVYKSLNCRFISGLSSKKIMLRHIFFRIGRLLENDVIPILIIEGPAPILKESTLIKRRQNFYRTKNVEKDSRNFQARDKFIYLLQECQVIAEAFGVPCIQSQGEAEALCAALNMSKVVAGCITDDSDAFLYGADVIYRNFSIKESALTCYKMMDIQEKLKLDREKLIALAVLLGCDFNSNGIPGIGKEKAMTWIYSLGKERILQRFEDWKQYDSQQSFISSETDHCLGDDKTSNSNSNIEDTKDSKLDSYIRQKFLSTKSNPYSEIINEFLDNRPFPLDKPFELKKPSLQNILEIGTEKLGWKPEYCIKKFFPFITQWNMKNKIKTGTCDINLLRILKSRTVKSIPCVEVEWNKPEMKELKDLSKDLFTTIEQKDLVLEAFPDEFKLFQDSKEGRTSDDKSSDLFQIAKGKQRSCKNIQSYKEDTESSDDEVQRRRRKKCYQQPTYTKVAVRKYHETLACNPLNTGSVTYLKMVLQAFQSNPLLPQSLQSIKKHITAHYLVSKNKRIFNNSIKKAITDALQTETLKKVTGKGIGGMYQLNVNLQSHPSSSAEDKR